jgi:alcohol dehydrogenase class IV
MKTIAETIGLPGPSGESFIAWLRDLNRKLGIPLRLTDCGVNSTHLEKLADLAILDPCHASNERPVTRSDFLTLYQKACS